MKDWWFNQSNEGGVMECVVTFILNWNWWSDSEFQGKPPGQDTDWIQGISWNIYTGWNI